MRSRYNKRQEKENTKKNIGGVFNEVIKISTDRTLIFLKKHTNVFVQKI